VEKKSTEISLVAASEKEKAQTDLIGVVGPQYLNNIYNKTVWKDWP
jgi:hypothetical protein